MPEPSNGPDMHNIYEKLGGMEATLRDVSHISRDNSSKIDALGTLVIKQGLIHEKVDMHTADIKEVQLEVAKVEKELDVRVSVLEVEMHRRQGAVGLLEWVSKHWPFTILGGSILAMVAWANGKLPF